MTLPVVKELTFWERKNTAHTVGDGAVIDVLARLAQMREIKAAHADDTTAETRLVVIGHSFGAAVVYSALDKVLAERFVYSRDEPGVSADIDGFGDLVVLVNPAFEAMRFTALSDMANERRTYFPGQLPVLAMLTSEADNATGTAFPLGRWFSTRFEKHRTMTRTNPVDGSEVTIHQRRANRTAVGHFTPYQTHRLVADDGEETAEPTDTAMFRRIAAGWENDGPGNVIRFRGSVLERSSDTVGRNPYLVVSVDPDLIPNHNDISDPAVVDFLTQLIQLSTQNPDLAERQRIRGQTSE